MQRIIRSGALIGAIVVLSLSAVPAQRTETDEPRRTDLVETTERRLVQIDVTVEGPREVISDLAPEDFRLAVGLEKIKDFVVDNICVLPDESPGQEVEVTVEGEAEPAPPAQRGVNFLFYFDQHHLTMAGRARSIDVTQELIPKLIVDGNRGMIVSAGEQLRTFTELTDDPLELLEGLRDLNNDHSQWDPWVQQEEDRIREIVEILNEPPYDFSRALSVARGYQREERWRTQKALHLFSMVLGGMAELDPPKAVVYYADTMRSNAGEHYLSFFSRRAEGAAGDASRLQSFDAAHAFDRVLEEATAMGIRVFTVEARGLTTIPTVSITHERAAGTASPVANTQPIRDAQNSMVGLAKESGGRAFLNGVRAKKIAARIERDLSCVYLLSFDASHLRENTTHRVVVGVDRPQVEVHARGQLTVQSESRKLTSRLMAAFASAKGGPGHSGVHGVVVPTGYDDGKYSALVQLSVSGSRLSRASWDLGLSLISGGEVAEDTSGRITTGGPGVPVVLEKQMRFRPGPFKLVGVAHETNLGTISTGEVEAEWPDPDDAEVTVGPVVVMQPTPAAILRGDELRREGAVGIPPDGLARTDRPTALVGIVCRAKGAKNKFIVERRLVGEGDSFAPFGEIELDLGDERCAQILDSIPPGSMSTGMFSYEVHVFARKDKKREHELASRVSRFAAAAPDEHPLAADGTGSL